MIPALVAAVCFCAGACRGVGAASSDAGWDDDQDPGTDSQDTDDIADSDPLVPAECESALIPACGENAYLLPPIVEAADFGEDVRFVDADPMAILAERETEGGFEMLVIARRTTWDIWSEAEIAVIPLGEGRAVDLTGPFQNQPFRHVALVCFADESCQLYAVGSPWDDPMEVWPMESGFLSPEAEARGVTGGDELFEDWVVAFGNGVSLFDDGWTTLYPQNTGPGFNAVGGDILAVGDAGRLSTLGFSESSWSDLDSGTESDFLDVVGWDDGVAIGAADGRFGLFGSGEPGWIALAEEPIVDLETGYAGETVFGLTESGCAFEAAPTEDDDETCVRGVMSEPGFAIVVWPCADVTNVSYLSEEGLYGFWDCWHTS